MVCVINDLTLELVTKNCHFQVICQMESERGVFNEHVFIPPEMKPHFQHDLFTPNFSRMQYVPNGIKVDLKSYEHDKQRESLSKDGDVIQDFLLYILSSTFRNTVFLSVTFFMSIIFYFIQSIHHYFQFNGAKYDNNMILRFVKIFCFFQCLDKEN